MPHVFFLRVWLLIVLGTLGLISGCGGRMANPVSQVSIFDRYMTCDQIAQEVTRNESMQSELAREQDWAQEKNDMVKGLALAFPPAWFAIDRPVEADYPNSPQDAEDLALGERNRHMMKLAQDKNCGSE